VLPALVQVPAPGAYAEARQGAPTSHMAGCVRGVIATTFIVDSTIETQTTIKAGRWPLAAGLRVAHSLQLYGYGWALFICRGGVIMIADLRIRI
jgi:hypothetical protein